MKATWVKDTSTDPFQWTECLNASYGHCVGDGTLYRHDNEWHMHTCLEEPLFMVLPTCWQPVGT